MSVYPTLAENPQVKNIRCYTASVKQCDYGQALCVRDPHVNKTLSKTSQFKVRCLQK